MRFHGVMRSYYFPNLQNVPTKYALPKANNERAHNNLQMQFIKTLLYKDVGRHKARPLQLLIILIISQPSRLMHRQSQ